MTIFSGFCILAFIGLCYWSIKHLLECFRPNTVKIENWEEGRK